MTKASPTRNVALIVETSNAYGRGLLTGIRKFVAERPRWSIFLAEHSRIEDDLTWLEGWRGHGVLARVETAETARFVRALRLPTVDLSAKRLAPELPCFETDDEMIADWAVRHFAERGLTDFAYCGDERFGWSLARGAALHERVRAAGGTISSFDIDPKERVLEQRGRMVRWLRSLPHPVGVLACYDIAGQEILQACRIAGLRVPDEVAVLGVDNDELFCNLTSPPLSSIQPDSVRTGFLAAQLLDTMMAGRTQPPGVRPIAPLRIAERQSSDVLAVADPQVAAALRLIRESSTAPIAIEFVLRHVGLSRRALDHRFEKLVGHTVHHEIVRSRMGHVARLLTATDWTLQQIAEHLGFSHAEYMGVMFKRETGEAPGEFRRRVAGVMTPGGASDPRPARRG
jgi:LacI family transcriptional regulator